MPDIMPGTDLSKLQPLRVSRILHAGYIFDYEGTKILFDPIFENPFSRNCFAFPKIDFDLEEIKRLKVDALFISHYHDDHCSLKSLNALDRQTPIYLFCEHDELFQWIFDLGFENVRKLKLNESVNVKDFQITPYKALNEDVDSIFHIQVRGLNILNVVDSWIGPDEFAVLSKVNWDLVMWPFQVMRELEVIAPRIALEFDKKIPIELLDQLRQLKTRVLIPSSCQFKFEDWSWYNDAFFGLSYAEFYQQVGELKNDMQLVRLEPSQCLELTHLGFNFGDDLSWINTRQETTKNYLNDYSYSAKTIPPQTSEIAQKFPPLNKEQTAMVLDFCTSSILGIYENLVKAESGFFSQLRNWKLILWDHQGCENEFLFELSSHSVLKEVDKLCAVDWLTEIPIQRLYGALFEGESLTSIYLRLHDMVYRPKIEELIKEADLFEDPLIRCLYEGKFGTYQQWQLSQLSNRDSRTHE